MKILLRHEHPGAKRLHGKRGHKILKKMAKLERKLGKYHLDESGEESCSSAGGRSRSRRRHRHHRRHGRRFASLGGRSSSSSSSCSDSDSSSDSGSSTSSSSDSSRSPSPGHRRHRHHHRHHGPPRHLSRSKSFAGRGCDSPPHFGPGHHQHHPPLHHRHHQHPHPPPHHRDQHHGHWRRHKQHRNGGICGLLYRSFVRSEPNLPEAEVPNAAENPAEEAAREPEVDATSVQELGNDEASARIDEPLEDPELNEIVSQKLSETLEKGLLADAKKSLLKKYPVSKYNVPRLRGPKLNQELLPVASETAIKRDSVLLYEQNQIGSGLTALGKAMLDLNAKAKAEHNLELIPILDAMGDAAAIIADAHHNITQMRQAFLGAELNKRVRPVVDSCKADELLFGKDFGDKVKDVRAFAKGKKGCEKKEKRKRGDQDGEKRKPKRIHEFMQALHQHGIMH